MSEKEFTIKPQDSFWRDKIFIRIALVFFGAAICFSVPLLFEVDWNQKPLSKLYHGVLTQLAFPFKILSWGFATAGFYAVIYRIQLTEKQIAQTQEQINENRKQLELSKLPDQFKLFIEHRKYIYEEIETLRQVDSIKSIDERVLYNSLFPSNTQTNFDMNPNRRLVTEMVHKVNSETERIEELIDKLEKGSTSEENEKLLQELYNTSSFNLNSFFELYGIFLKDDWVTSVSSIAPLASFFIGLERVLDVLAFLVDSKASPLCSHYCISKVYNSFEGHFRECYERGSAYGKVKIWTLRDVLSDEFASKVWN